MWQNQKIWLKIFDPKLIKFLITGVFNTIFGYSVYAGLVFISVPYAIALFIATVAGVIFNFFSFGGIVFKSNRSWKVFSRFIIAYAAVYIVNVFFLQIFTSALNLNAYWGQIICVPLNVTVSWILMNFWVYKKD